MSLDTDFFQVLDQPLDAVVLRRIFLLLMQLHYSDVANYGADAERLNGLVYQPDGEHTSDNRLHVDLTQIYASEKQTVQNAILVGLGPLVFTKKVIDNFARHNEDTSSVTSVLDCSTLIKIKHIGKTADLALLLGQQSMAFLNGIRQFLIPRMRLRAFDIGSLSEPGEYQGLPDRLFDVDLVCPIIFSFVMATNLESHRIKKFALTISPLPLTR
jgi:hypothetical protein